MNAQTQSISIVISSYNEEAGILNFWKKLQSILGNIPDTNFEVIWVNDGSSDKTQNRIKRIKSENSTVNIKNVSIEFSKNFGHEAAMIAGIDTATGDAVLCMDSDLQHPPEKIPEMINVFNSGADIVLMERNRRADNCLLKNFLSSLFYKVINLLSAYKFHENSTDFFLISKRIIKIMKLNFRERNRFLRGFIQSIGFKKNIIKFDAPARIYGKSSYSYMCLFKLAFNAIFSFSNIPLRLSILVSIIFTFFTLVLGIYSLYMYFFGDKPPSGYTTIIIFLSASFSVLFVLVTILSLYFEKSIEETRQRPIYIIKEKSNE